MSKGRSSCSCLAVLVLLFLTAVAGVLFYVAYPIVFAPPPEPKETVWPEALVKIKRVDWGQQAIANPDRVTPMSEIKKITIHHDGLPPLAMSTETQIKKRVVAIREQHSLKYADIGYHYIVDPKGRIWEARPIEYQGAHAQRHNVGNVGVLFLGNTSDTKPTQAGLDGLYMFLRYLRQRYDVPINEIYTHAELGQTECPGKHLQSILETARKDGTLDIPDLEQPIDWPAIIDEFKNLPNKLFKIKEKITISDS